VECDIPQWFIGHIERFSNAISKKKTAPLIKNVLMNTALIPLYHRILTEEINESQACEAS